MRNSIIERVGVSRSDLVRVDNPIIRAGGTWAEGKYKLIPSCVPCHLAWFMEISGQSRARGIFSSIFPFSCLVALAWIYPPPSNSGIFPGLVGDPLGGDWESWVGG